MNAYEARTNPTRAREGSGIFSANPLIGELKKANKSGKFQLSDLKDQARYTVTRIAALPRSFYF